MDALVIISGNQDIILGHLQNLLEYLPPNLQGIFSFKN